MYFKKLLTLSLFLVFFNSLFSQDYFLEKYKPFNSNIPTPEEFLGYGIGEYHTRHDLIVAYFNKLAEISEKAEIEVYGKSNENRKLVMLRVSNKENLKDLDNLKKAHLEFVDTKITKTNYDEIPVFINLGYGVHGNEPSSSEAALLIAYTLVASENPEILNYIDNAVIFIDPTINPDGRDRHSNWANQYRSENLVSDNIEAEHNEAWPRGRTNHYWFDLNRDWLLAVHPESQSKLKWYHSWYPNVVTDFHEMGTNSTYFFEPKRTSALLTPLPPKENYEKLNNTFAKYFQKSLDSVGSFYFTSEAFDGTYPGYGSTYGDLQGGLALLFEQASSRGHIQDTDFGKITFPFTIRNQYISSLATIEASVNNKAYLREYQQDFFKSAVKTPSKNSIAGYEFSEKYDKNRQKAFVEFLLKHKIEVYKNNESFVVPLNQPQKRMVQTMFETNKKFLDSVFYDASAWNVVDFYNINYKELKKSPALGEKITDTSSLLAIEPVTKTNYAYVLDWDDYNASEALYFLQSKGLKAASAFKPFTIETAIGVKSFNYGSMMFPVSKQKFESEKVYKLIVEAQKKFNVPVYAVNSGMSSQGIPLGSRDFIKVDKPKVAMLIGEGVSSYEAGEVWHLLDTRIKMPITKIQLHNFGRADFSKYNTLVMVSGSYYQLDSIKLKKLQNWVKAGNTLITIGGASKWAVSKKVVSEKLVENAKDSLVNRVPYVNSAEDRGKHRLGGAIFEVDLDVTHPLGFGYRDGKVPVYKNNLTFIKASKNKYSTVSKYTEDPLLNGFVSQQNLDLMSEAASLIVSPLGSGRVILFADNPNFRGAWYGTNKMFMNALFFGSKIRVPRG